MANKNWGRVQSRNVFVKRVQIAVSAVFKYRTLFVKTEGRTLFVKALQQGVVFRNDICQNMVQVVYYERHKIRFANPGHSRGL